jgi:DNA-binding CsgD family transcriptional regulator
MTKVFSQLENQMQEPTDTDCLEAIADLANQLGLDSRSETLQGKELEAISIAREVRDDLKRLLESASLSGSGQPLVALTERELEVLRWASLGKSASVTAQILRVSEKAVRKARESAGRKLNSHNIMQSVVTATRLGLF